MMMNVRIVRVLVGDRCMSVPMNMWFCQIQPSVVLVLIVLIMRMSMCMLKRFVGVFMIVRLGEMKPDTQAHQCGGKPKRGCCGFS